MTLGVSALINLCISLVCIVFAWRVLWNVKLEKWLRVPNPSQARALLILLSIAIGHQVARFLIDYLDWSRLIGQTLF